MVHIINQHLAKVKCGIREIHAVWFHATMFADESCTPEGAVQRIREISAEFSGDTPCAIPLRDSMKAKGLPPHLYKSGGRWRRNNAIEEIKRLDALLEYAVQHNDTAEAVLVDAGTHQTLSF